MQLEREPGEFKQLGASLAALAGIGAFGWSGAWGASLQLAVGGLLLARWYLKKSDPGLLLTEERGPAHLALPGNTTALRPASVAAKRLPPREDMLLALQSPEFYFFFAAMAGLISLFDLMGAAAVELAGRSPDAYATAFYVCGAGAASAAGLGTLVGIAKKVTRRPDEPRPPKTAEPAP